MKIKVAECLMLFQLCIVLDVLADESGNQTAAQSTALPTGLSSTEKSYSGETSTALSINAPSLELLEFLGEWELEDGSWFDPLQLENLVAKQVRPTSRAEKLEVSKDE